MVRSRKWLACAESEQPLTAVARKAIRDRLRAVRHFLPLAAKHGHAEIEYVHQLRVATRRARAALLVFRDLLPKRHAKWMKHRLSRLRRAAGAARDLDVLGERLRKLAEGNGYRLDRVFADIAVRRRGAQKSLADCCKAAKRKQLTQRMRDLAKKVRPMEQGDPTFGEAARTRLVPLVDEFFAAAKADLSDVTAMHRLRISGKQLRYAMELLWGAFDDAFRNELYVTIQELQERLGSINDLSTAIATLTELLHRSDCEDTRGELMELIANEKEMLAAKRIEFRCWWTSPQAAELSQRFAEALAAQSRPSAKNDFLA